MQIFVNGDAHTLEGPLSLADLLHQLGLSERRLAVEVNREIVPKSAHASHQLAEGDRLELVQAMGGG